MVMITRLILQKGSCIALPVLPLLLIKDGKTKAFLLACDILSFLSLYQLPDAPPPPDEPPPPLEELLELGEL